MKKRMKWIAGIGIVLLVAGLGFAEPLKGARTGTFVGTSGAWTNTTGDKIQLTAVILYGTLNSSTDSWVTVTNPSKAAFILVKDGATNTVAWYSGSGGMNLERDGVLTFGASSTAVATNSYRIEGR